MAAAKIIGYDNGDGSAAWLNYDDVSLIASSFTVGCGRGAISDLSWWYRLKNGATLAGITARGQTQTIEFPTPLQGVVATDPMSGNSFPDFGIAAFGAGYGA